MGDTIIETIKRECVPHPQICFAAVDDYITSHERCLQVTQFESDIRIAQQMYELSFIERGGANDWESYADVWYFAKYHTKCDAIRKGRKGVIITIGDDGIQPVITKNEISNVFGDNIEDDVSTEKLLSQINRDWEVFHISMAEGANYNNNVKKIWDKYLGERHIVLDDTEKLSEVIVSLLQTLKGDTVEKIAETWDSGTALVIRNTLGRLSAGNNENNVVIF